MNSLNEIISLPESSDVSIIKDKDISIVQDTHVSREEIESQIDSWVYGYISTNFQFRKYQKEKIIDIIENIVSSRKNHNHVIEAPTGSGKSLIIIISAGVLEHYYKLKSYILCSDLFLWKQYADFIKEHRHLNFGMIKGKYGNYTCDLNKEDLSNADCQMAQISWASLFNKEKAKKLGYECAEGCEYCKNRKKAIKSPVTLMTYQLFFYIMQNVTEESSHDNFNLRPVVFCDECHNIPDILAGKFSPIFRLSDIDKLLEIYDYAKPQYATLFDDNTKQYSLTDTYLTREKFETELQFLFKTFLNTKTYPQEDYDSLKKYSDILMMVAEIADDIKTNISERKKNHEPISDTEVDQFKLTSWLKKYKCYIGDFGLAIQETGIDYFLKQVSSEEDIEDRTIIFSCTKEDYLCYKHLLCQSDWKVMLSATVGGQTAFEENIGTRFTEDKKSLFEVVPSTFNFDKSPVIFLNRYKMNFANKSKSLQNLIPIIYKICEQFKGKKGMIQTGTYDIQKQIIFNSPYSIQKRFLPYNGSKEKAGAINKHHKSDDTILIGPTLTEGIDLPNDDCRFIVILKMPYPNMTDKYVGAKMKLFPLWYNSKTSNSIIQGIGRGVRNETDYCTTYILDGCFYNLYLNTKDQYSDELQKRIKMYK